MKTYQFKLYITGQSFTSKLAVDKMQHICETLLGNDCEVMVVDVLIDPQQAEADHILATPTLIRIAPPPVRRVIGDLSDHSKVSWALQLPTSELPFSKGADK